MSKLSFHPTREELKRLRERWDREDAEEIPLKPFDITLTSGIDDTVKHLRILRDEGSRSTAEDERLRFDAIERLTAEAHYLRTALAGVIETLNHKASKKLMAKTLGEYSTKFDKRVDNIFKLISVVGVILGLIIAWASKAH